MYFIEQVFLSLIIYHNDWSRMQQVCNIAQLASCNIYRHSTYVIHGHFEELSIKFVMLQELCQFMSYFFQILLCLLGSLTFSVTIITAETILHHPHQDPNHPHHHRQHQTHHQRQQRNLQPHHSFSHSHNSNQQNQEHHLHIDKDTTIRLPKSLQEQLLQHHKGNRKLQVTIRFRIRHHSSATLEEHLRIISAKRTGSDKLEVLVDVDEGLPDLFEGSPYEGVGDISPFLPAIFNAIL